MPGNDVPGGFAHHLAAPAAWVAPVPEGTSREMLEELSVIADAVSTPYEAAVRAGITAGDLAVVVGAGGVGGFLITKGSPPEALDFMKFFTSPEQQSVAAAKGFYVPTVKGTDAVITNPLIAAVSRNVANSTWHQLFFDQDLGPSVGRVVNDMSVAVAAGEATPEEAAAAIQEAWDQR
jgi:ABC-type glycerol-3-phosphate transport system substrate-binding protein